jgi:signal transduction histidine kinase
MLKLITRRIGYYIGISAAFILIFIYVDINRNNAQLNESLQAEAQSLMISVKSAATNSIVASATMEDEITDKLNGFAWLAENFADNTRDFSKLQKRLNLEVLAAFDYDLDIIISANNYKFPNSEFKLEPLKNDLSNMIDNHYKWLEIGVNDSITPGKSLYLLARNDLANKRIILIGMDASKLSTYRKKFGAGSLLSGLAENTDIAYISLSDSAGIIAYASNKSPIYQYGKFKKTVVDTSDEDDIYELSDTVSAAGVGKISIKIGLFADRFANIQYEANFKTLTIALFFFVSNIFIFIIFNSRKAISKLRREKSEISKYNDLIIRNMNDCFLALDESLNIITANKSAKDLLAYDKEIVGINYYDLFPNDVFDVKNISSRHFDYKEIEFNIRGSQIAIAYSLSEFSNENGGSITAIIFRNISKEKELRDAAQLKEKADATGRLAAGVAHEIRNPLNAINIIAQRLEMEFEPKECEDEYFSLTKTVRSEIARLNRIIKQFMEFAKPAPISRSKTCLFEFTKEIVELLEPELKSRNISLEYEFRLDKNRSIMLDVDKIKQALINLIRNAADAIQDEGRVKFEAFERDSHIYFCVNDDGCGIGEADLSKIFNLYFTTKKSGSGLGLSVAHQIVSEHGGSISVKSKIGEGSEFIIKLPI